MRYYRKVIKVSCEDSPNVRLARMEIAAGIEPSGRTVVPGVIGWHTLQHHRQVWDIVRQTVGLDGEFYEGSQLLLFPPEWLNNAEARYRSLRGLGRHGRAMGIDPAEGGDSTAIAIVDELGLVELISEKTADTSVIAPRVMALMDRYGIPPERVCFDRGGGGKQIADHIRSMGRKVRTVGFGEAIALDPKRGLTRIEDRLGSKEEGYSYVNRRAQMYGELSMLMDPAGENTDAQGHYVGFALPPGESGPQYIELRKQLGPMDRLFDKEGRQRMRPKNRVGKATADAEKTLVELIGNSPDEADALVLAVHALLHKAPVQRAGVVA